MNCVICVAILFTFNQISFAEESGESREVDLITYMDELQNDIRQTMKNLELIDDFIGADIRQISADIAILADKRAQLIENQVGQYSPVFTRKSMNCILQLTEDALDSQEFVDPVLDEQCQLTTQFEVQLEEAIDNLLIVEDEAKKLPIELLHANLWCSTNFDEAECYEKVTLQIAEKAEKLMATHVKADQLQGALTDELNLTQNKCIAFVGQKLQTLHSFVTDTIKLCAQS